MATLTLIRSVLDKIKALSLLGVLVNGVVLTGIYSLVSVPLSAITASYIIQYASVITSGIDGIITDYESIRNGIRSILYDGTNTETVNTTLQNYIDSASIGTISKGLLKVLFSSQVIDSIYNVSSTIDTSGYYWYQCQSEVVVLLHSYYDSVTNLWYGDFALEELFTGFVNSDKTLSGLALEHFNRIDYTGTDVTSQVVVTHNVTGQDLDFIYLLQNSTYTRNTLINVVKIGVTSQSAFTITMALRVAV